MLESHFSHNFCAFYLYLVLESNSNLRAGIFEGLLYGELSIWQIPYTIYDGTHTYICAIPLTYLMQVVLLGANLQLNLPYSLHSLWFQKHHIEGWVEVDLKSTEYNNHWLFCCITVVLFASLSSWYDVYNRIKWLNDFDPNS